MEVAKKATEFEKGYVCAVSCIWRNNGGSTITTDDALGCIGIGKIDIKSFEDIDRPMLLEYLEDAKIREQSPTPTTKERK